MSKVVSFENHIPKCRFEVKNIYVKDLLKPEYANIDKYFPDSRPWDNKLKNRFIESLMLGFIPPSIFIYENKNNQRFIIDGYNRIKTINEFIKDEFPLERVSKYNWFWLQNGKSYSKLSDAAKYRFDNCSVVLNLITKATEEDIRRLYINLNS